MKTNLIAYSSSPVKAVCISYSALNCLPQFCKLAEPDSSSCIQLHFKKVTTLLSIRIPSSVASS